MAINTLLEKYQELKQSPVTNQEELHLVSSQIVDLAELCHSFYSKEFTSLPEVDFLISLSKKGELIIQSIKEIKIGQVIVSYKNKDIIINLLSPESLVMSFLSDSPLDIQLLAQLYLSQPRFYLLVNLGLFLEKQG